MNSLDLFQGRSRNISDEVDAIFKYKPWNEEKIQAGGEVRDALAEAFKVALEFVPAGPDRSAGLRKLREARMDFNSAITFDGKY